MAQIWKPQPPEVYAHWANAVFDEARGSLNDRQLEFIESLLQKFEILPTYKLTQKQAEWLEDIYAKYTK